MEQITSLSNRRTWETTSESEFQKIRHKVKAIFPSMAISTIKFDETFAPKRAKYRLLPLGNLNPFHWTQGDTYAPATWSMIELCLLTSLAVRENCVRKSGDVKQAFVQASLLNDKLYVS